MSGEWELGKGGGMSGGGAGGTGGGGGGGISGVVGNGHIYHVVVHSSPIFCFGVTSLGALANWPACDLESVICCVSC